MMWSPAIRSVMGKIGVVIDDTCLIDYVLLLGEPGVLLVSSFCSYNQEVHHA